MKNVKSFDGFLKESLSSGGKNSPRWNRFKNVMASMVPTPELVGPEPSDPSYQTLGWGSFLDPSKRYGVSISTTTSDLPNEEIVFGIEDRDLAEEIGRWWEKRGYKMKVGNVPSSGDNPDDVPSVPISFDKPEEIKRNLISFFKDIPF